MRTLFYIFSLFVMGSVLLFSQDAFPGLKKMEIDKPVYVYFKPSECKVLNKIIPDEAEFKMVNVLMTRLIPELKDSFLIRYSEGPSYDPCFLIYRIDKEATKRLSPGIGGLNLFIPGDGFLYSSGHTNNMYDTHRKFKVLKDTLVEVTQPFYYVGINSEVIADIFIYSEMEMINPVATVVKGSSVFVVANQDDYYLIKTPFGLLGWTNIPGGAQKTNLDGIRFAGD